MPVYVVQSEDQSRPERTLHCNLLLPIGHVPVEEIRKQTADNTLEADPEPPALAETETEYTTSSDSDDESDIVIVEEVVSHQPTGHTPQPMPVAVAAAPEPANQIAPPEAEPPPQPLVQQQQQPPDGQTIQPVPVPAPRRFNRVARPPAWVTSGEYQVDELRRRQAAANSQPPPTEAEHLMDSLSSLMHDDTISGSVRGEIAILMLKKLQRFESS